MHLTDRERQVLERVGKGEKLEAIAAELEISYFTVRFHLKNIRRKADVDTTIQAIIFFCSHPTHRDSSLKGQLMLFD